MTNTYTLHPKKLKTDGPNSIVAEVLWGYEVVTADGKKGMIAGATKITHVEGSPFTPFNELTPQQVADWVVSAWTPEETAMYQSLVNDHVRITDTPWGN